jgi:hypothetical protein
VVPLVSKYTAETTKHLMNKNERARKQPETKGRKTHKTPFLLVWLGDLDQPVDFATLWSWRLYVCGACCEVQSLILGGCFFDIQVLGLKDHTKKGEIPFGSELSRGYRAIRCVCLVAAPGQEAVF